MAEPLLATRRSRARRGTQGNVWSVHGYRERLVRLGMDEPARIVKQQHDVALARADVPIRSSCFCRMTHHVAVT